MTYCPTCREEFSDRFVFCPVDGTPLNDESVVKEETLTYHGIHSSVVPPSPTLPAAQDTPEPAEPRGEYHLTMLEDAGLPSRLARELREASNQPELAWPELLKEKEEPPEPQPARPGLTRAADEENAGELVEHVKFFLTQILYLLLHTAFLVALVWAHHQLEIYLDQLRPGAHREAIHVFGTVFLILTAVNIAVFIAAHLVRLYRRFRHLLRKK